jgi:hypothetical protein
LVLLTTPTDEVKETGTITVDMLEGPMKGKLLPELSLAGAHGSLYITIHADQYPNVEIHGQVKIPY